MLSQEHLSRNGSQQRQGRSTARCAVLCCAMPCCAMPCCMYSAEPAWPGELPALAQGEALIPGWARGNCLSAGCSPGTAGM